MGLGGPVQRYDGLAAPLARRGYWWSRTCHERLVQLPDPDRLPRRRLHAAPAARPVGEGRSLSLDFAPATSRVPEDAPARASPTSGSPGGARAARPGVPTRDRLPGGRQLLRVLVGAKAGTLITGHLDRSVRIDTGRRIHADRRERGTGVLGPAQSPGTTCGAWPPLADQVQLIADRHRVSTS